MDPMSALTIAASVVQFVDYAGKVITSTKRIYKTYNNDAGENVDVKTITESLVSFYKDLSDNLQTTMAVSSHDQPMISLCQRCRITCDELIAVLASLSKQACSVWGSFQVAIGSIWGADKVKELRSRIDDYRQQMTMILLLSLKYVSSFLIHTFYY
jgi:hypothetical protein